MSEEISEQVSKIDFKEIKITAGITLVTSLVGCAIAVILVQTLVMPAITKAKEKKAAKELAAKK